VSPSTDRDRGFSLIEIVVALGVLSVVLIALLPQLVVGIQSTGTARQVSQAKGVAQGELERMRNLPYHISPAAGDFVDVLDNYFPDDDAPGTAPVCMSGEAYNTPATTWSGYVAAASAARCDYEPSGPFYRVVKEIEAEPGIGRFVLVVNTQFLSGATPPSPVAPLAGYDTQDERYDSPAATQIGVSLTVLYDDRETLRPVTTYTQISQQLPSVNRVRAEAEVRVLETGSVTADGVPLSLSAGLLNLQGTVSYASTATANLSAVSGGLATGEQGAGAGSVLSAPPTDTVTPESAAAGSLGIFECAYACWGSSQLSGFVLNADEGLPNVGSVSTPAAALITSNDNGGVSFGNSSAANYRPDRELTPPLVRFAPSATAVDTGLNGCAAGTGGTQAYASATGYVTTTGGTTGSVEACGVARSGTIALFPTTFAPEGVVQIELQRASARCLVTGADHSATAERDFLAVVRYFVGGAEEYAEVEVSPGADNLAAVDLEAPRSKGPLAEGTYQLSDYIVSWTALTSGQVQTATGTGNASLTLPGVVTIATQPMRGTVEEPVEPSPSPTADPSDSPTATPTPEPEPEPIITVDPTSVLSLTVGAVSCTAEDQR